MNRVGLTAEVGIRQLRIDAVGHAALVPVWPTSDCRRGEPSIPVLSDAAAKEDRRRGIRPGRRLRRDVQAEAGRFLGAVPVEYMTEPGTVGCRPMVLTAANGRAASPQ